MVICALLLLARPAAADELADRLGAALLRLGPHATCAVRVVALDSPGEVRYEHNADLSLNPASNMKLFTSAAALAKLGPDYRFRTRVLAAGHRRGAALRGDLVLVGGGDPTLETPGLAALAQAVRDVGIRTVRGDLLVDDTRYDAQRLGFGWNWDDEPFYYSAQISALSVNRNVLQVRALPGAAVGEPARVTAGPAGEYVTLQVDVKTAAADGRTALQVDRERGRNVVRVTGTVALGAAAAEEEVTMEEPHRYAGALLREELEARGVKVRGKVRPARAPAEAQLLSEHVSEPLSRIAALLNKPSDNLIAEMLLKELGYTQRGKGDANAGSTVVEGWLRETGIAPSGVKVNDGSGLSRMDLVTARAVTELLRHAESQPWRQAFVDSLPLAAVDGTLRRRLAGTAAERNVRAKTGSLLHVSALGGYVTTAGGRRLAFSILINQFTGPGSAKRIEDLMAVALAEDRAPAAPAR